MVFRIGADGTGLTVLRSFNAPTDGGSPKGNLVQGSDGYFYGLTFSGGKYDRGAAFKIKSDGSGFTVLRSFDPAADGFYPSGSLVQGKDGYFYGMTSFGGKHSGGVIFKISSDGTDYKVLRDFESLTDGRAPYGSLLQLSDGYFYGLTSAGGSKSRGTVFKVNSDGTEFTVLRNLSSAEGAYPQGSLVQGADGYLYGMGEAGGAYGENLQGNEGGTIFKIGTDGKGFAVLKDFNSATDGSSPFGDLLQGSDGYFYGMTWIGGTKGGGTVFKIKSDGNDFTVLKHLDASTDGASPYGSLVQDLSGSLLGMTSRGGAGFGTVFKINTDGSGFTLLSNFIPSPEDILRPDKSVMQGADGFLYGTATYGGPSGFGTFLKMRSDGTVIAVLKNFTPEEGVYPNSKMVQGTDGYFYSMTAASGGTNSHGTIYKIKADGTGFSVLKRFNNATDGSFPHAGLIQGADGSFYGMTHTSDDDNNLHDGTIFKINGDGFGFAVLKAFTGGTDGGSPQGGLVQGRDGKLYGMAQSGIIFRVNTNGTEYTVIRKMDTAKEGFTSYGSLVQGSDGYFYGMTQLGGTYWGGTIFKINSDGTDFAILRHFNAATDGNGPLSDLVEGADGSFYGMTPNGGSNGFGTIFKVSADGSQFSVLRHLSPEDGVNPQGSLVLLKAISCTPPAPSFTAAPLCAGSATVFSDASANVAAGATYAWDVDNDGTTDYTTRGNISHTYATAGTYTAKLTIRQGSCEERFMQQVEVLESPVPSLVSSDADNVINPGDEVMFTAGGGTAYTFYLNGEVVQEASEDNTWSSSGLSDKARIKVLVASAGGCSAESAELTVSVLTPGAAPVVSSFSPAAGIVDTRVTIKGKNFNQVQQVTFNGVPSSFYVKDKYTIKAYVPMGAKTGNIVVATASGNSKSDKKFKVTKSGPAIVSFTPAAGPEGAEVTLIGANLKHTTSVSFNGVAAAKVKVVDDNTVLVIIPKGAKSSKISISTKDGTDISKAKFIVTPEAAAVSAQKLQVAEPEEALQVYPNPFVQKASVNFTLQQGGAYVVELYDATGRLVTLLKNGTAEPGARNQVEVDGSKLARGLYIVRLHSKEGSRTKTLVLDK